MKCTDSRYALCQSQNRPDRGIAHRLRQQRGVSNIQVLRQTPVVQGVRFLGSQRKHSAGMPGMLSQTLRELEADGLIDRKQFNEVPPHVEYSLTERGKSIVPILAELGTWATGQMEIQCKAPACGECTTKC